MSSFDDDKEGMGHYCNLETVVRRLKVEPMPSVLRLYTNQRKLTIRSFFLQLKAGIDHHDRLGNNNTDKQHSRNSSVGGLEDPEAVAAATATSNTTTDISDGIPDLCNHLSVSSIFKEKNNVPQVENVATDKRETGVADNDDLVTYLEQTGSILALAQRLDEEDVDVEESCN